MKRLAKTLSFPLWQRLRWRIENVTDQRFGPQLDDVRRSIEHAHEGIATLRRELDELRVRTDGLEGGANALDGARIHHRDELRLMAAQLSALETRVATVERPVLAETGETPSGVEEVRAEHARIRARLTAVAKYEERLARVEDTLIARTVQET